MKTSTYLVLIEQRNGEKKMSYMKYKPCILLLLICLIGCVSEKPAVNANEYANLVDNKKAERSIVVLRVRLLEPFGGSKYHWDKVQVIDVMKNKSTSKFNKELQIAHYNTKAGIPQGESTVYLVPYNKAEPGNWLLLEGDGKIGVSHNIDNK